MNRGYGLERFLTAQADTYQTAITEIRRGLKRGHWMGFIFPQIAGLSRSTTGQQYALRSLKEAEAYLAHPLLGVRLRECVGALLDLTDLTAGEVFGDVDAEKLRSSLTLFIEAGAGPLLKVALERWFDGEKDKATLRLLGANDNDPSGVTLQLS